MRRCTDAAERPMDLILWRHAEAEEARAAATTSARALTAKGERQAERMAEWLNQRLAALDPHPGQPGAALPADGQGARAQVPHRRGARARRRAPRRCSPSPAGPMPASRCSSSATSRRSAWPRRSLLGGAAQPWAIKKGAVWWLRHRPRDDDGAVVLQAVQSPDCL